MLGLAACASEVSTRVAAAKSRITIDPVTENGTGTVSRNAGPRYDRGEKANSGMRMPLLASVAARGRVFQLAGVTFMDTLIVAVAVFLVAINVVVTVVLVRSLTIPRKQRLAQLGIVWIVPIVGAASIALFLYSIRRTDAPHAMSRRNEQDEYPGVNLYPPHGPSDT